MVFKWDYVNYPVLINAQAAIKVTSIYHLSGRGGAALEVPGFS